MIKLRQQRQLEENEAAEKIDADVAMSDPAKIDCLAKARRWFDGDTTLISTYLSGTLTGTEVADRMAAPIDETYSSADHGTRLYHEEIGARIQRTYHEPDKALEMWGPEEDIPKPGEETADLPTTEGQLWELWYGILHAAKRISYTEAAEQEKLLDLIRILKARPDPQPPTRMTVPLRRNWIWETGTLWSDLLMFGPSVTEVLNDSCGCGSGWLPVERRAWINVSSFLARGTGSGVFTQTWIGRIALRSATEDDLESHPNLHHIASVPTKLECHVPEAALWVLLAGGKVLEEYPRIRDGQDLKAVDDFIDQRGVNLPWNRSKRKYKGPRYEDLRMEFLRRRFEVESQNTVLLPETRRLAEQAALKIATMMSC